MNRKKLVKVLSAALLAFSLLSIAHTLKAQSPEPQKPTSEVQQLKERLRQLEHAVDLLKTQITSMEAKKPDSTAAGEKVGAPATVAAAPAPAQQPPDDAKGESTFQIYGCQPASV